MSLNMIAKKSTPGSKKRGASLGLVISEGHHMIAQPSVSGYSDVVIGWVAHSQDVGGGGGWILGVVRTSRGSVTVLCQNYFERNATYGSSFATWRTELTFQPVPVTSEATALGERKSHFDHGPMKSPYRYL